MKARLIQMIVLGVPLLSGLNGCRNSSGNRLRVGVTPGPGEEILQTIQSDLRRDGVELEIVSFTDYIQPDLALASHDLDANLYQNAAFLNQFNRDHGTQFVELEKVYLPLMAIYPGKSKSLDALRPGARVALPNDPVNLGRALQLLQSAGLIQLRSEAKVNADPSDVAANPTHLVLVQLDAAQLPRSLEDVDLAVINANFALNAGLDPHRDALYVESPRSPYANGLAVNSDLRNDGSVQKLAALLRGPHTQRFIHDHYHGALFPAG